jgi:hypothetical protein
LISYQPIYDDVYTNKYVPILLLNYMHTGITLLPSTNAIITKPQQHSPVFITLVYL